MKLLIISDAWKPQTNGVVTTLESLIELLETRGVEVQVLEPSQGWSLPCPGYKEIRLALNPWRVVKQIRTAKPDAIHIATEGPLGITARAYLKRNNIEFTTSLHTKFPEYVKARLGIPLRIGYKFLRRFHSAANSTLVTTASHKNELTGFGLKNLAIWGRGVDTKKFFPASRLSKTNRIPKLLYVGRLAVEKNISAFLDLEVEGQKIVVGDGPQRNDLEKKYPHIQFVGCKKGRDLVNFYQQADVFVFPSKTDTFGLVMLEAMACGVPVAAYPVTGPIDLVCNGYNGALADNLHVAIKEALLVDRVACRKFALNNSWHRCADRFFETLVLLPESIWQIADEDKRHWRRGWGNALVLQK